MNELEILAIATLLVGVALVYLRSASHGHEVLAWSAAWVSLAAAATVASGGESGGAARFTGQVFGMLFPALLLVGAIGLRRRRNAWWILGVALVVGVARAVLTSTGLEVASVAVSAPVKFALIAASAWIVWPSRAASLPGMAERMLGPSLLLMAFVDGLSPVARLGSIGLDPGISFLAWAFVVTGLATAQVGTIVGRYQLAAEQQADQLQRLEASEARRQALLTAIPDVLIRLSRDLRILDISSSHDELLVAPPQRLIGRKLVEVGFPVEFANRAIEIAERVRQSGVVNGAEFEFPVLRGSRNFEVRIVPGCDDDMLIVARDITANKNALEQEQILRVRLQEAQKLESLGVMAGGVAHDFNNLLGGIINYTDLALSRLDTEAPARESIEKIQTVASRMAALSNLMLAYAGKAKLTSEPIDLTRVVAEIAPLLQSLVSTGIELQFELAQNLPPIQGDSSQIVQVVMNLVLNASDSLADQPGMIVVGTGQIDGEPDSPASSSGDDDRVGGPVVYLRVSDTGCGMGPETASRIFDPFFTTKAGGKGLGMTSVLGIVRGHGGRITLDSAPGHGSSFLVQFPAHKESRNAIPADPSPRVPSR